MAISLYIEDTFSTFYDLCLIHTDVLQRQDLSACESFYTQLATGKNLTANQGSYLLKILEKYKFYSKNHGFDYVDVLPSLVWKNTFRTLDLSRSVFVEQTDKGVNVCLKFPYNLKKEFETEIENNKADSNSKWDHDRKLRVMNLYDHNIIHLHEFCQKHNFDIDNSFLDAVSQVEEIWQSQDTIINYSIINDDKVELKNAVDSTVEYWNANKTGSINHDLFLAKVMGYPVKLQSTATTAIEKISSSKEKSFWMKTPDNFFELYKDIGGIACILLDRNTKNIVEWLENFVAAAEPYMLRNLIKVCFRDESDKSSTLNQWIKNQSLGGKVDEGKILIFNHKPPKWLFTKNIDVKIIVTNSYTPHNEPISSTWLSSHPCVCYVGDIKPTPARNKKIVSL
jgi:hypothetical protein